MRILTVGSALFALTFFSGCKKSDQPTAKQAEKASSRTLRLGFFPNVTHAQALVGNLEGTFQKAMGDKQLDVKQFNAGPAAMEALVSGSLDVTYVGSGPAINTYLKAGKGLRVIAGAVHGGAIFVTRTAKTPEELKGKKLATPQLGNSQDIALRHWLKEKGLKIGAGKDEVSVTPLANADILSLFMSGGLEGAWVPEPWGARLIAEGKARLFFDEKELWPDGKFPTTLLVTTDQVLKSRPEEVKALLRAHLELTRRWEKDPDGFAQKVNQGFEALTKKSLGDAVLKDAFSRIKPGLDPLPAVLKEQAKHAKELGFIPSDDVEGLVDTKLLESLSST